ncbi:MAG: PCMD domain-containing protein, partial [Bacteroidales bacterium]|nr:PCMD domain-containing protein [Bacteroidales bacterium]
HLDDTLLLSLTPVITISENATIYPTPDVAMDFSHPVTFVVTSQSGDWQRTYTVNIVNNILTNPDFEQWKGSGSGNNFFETPTGWSSANAGVRMIHGIGYPELEFPTYKTEDAFSGHYAVVMNTRRGGQSSLVPNLIAGSLFLGYLSNVTMSTLANPLLLTKFGVPYTETSRLPDSLIGYLKYVPGPEYQDPDANICPDSTDRCSFYAVFFEGDEPLDGTNSQTSDRIIAIAKYNNETPISSTSYTRISLPFVYRKAVPQGVPLQYTIIASSSTKGDYFEGAAGSMLYLDKVDVKLKNM